MPARITSRISACEKSWKKRSLRNTANRSSSSICGWSAQLLVDARQLRGELGAGAIAVVGFLLRARGRRRASRSSGISGRTLRNGSGCRCTTCCSSLPSAPARNGRWPHSISYITAPSEYRSERASSSRPCTCSGDMYAGLPATPSSREMSESATSAMPKSTMRDVAVLREQDVRRLDVAMHDAARMRVVQRLRALVDDRHDLLDRQQAAGAAVGAQRARTVHVLGDDVAAAVLLARVEDRHDVRVLHLADHLRLAEEHAASIAALGVVTASWRDTA